MNIRKFMRRNRKLLIFAVVLTTLALFFCIGASANETTGSAEGGVNALGDFVEIMVSGITQLATGMADGITAYVTKLFLATNSSGAITGLSTTGTVVAIFAGLAIATGVTAMVWNWITSLGN